MKPNKSINRRRWCPHGYITDSGLLLSPSHVATASEFAVRLAAMETTAIITRMMKP